jgi:hypothetical protein
MAEFYFLLGKTATETFEMLKTAYNDDFMGKTQVFEWFPVSKVAKCQLIIKLP